MNLEKLGWSHDFQTYYEKYSEKGFFPARVFSQQKNNYMLYSEKGVLSAKLSGRFRHTAVYNKHFPTVGDWVVVQVIDNNGQAIIYDIIPRKNAFARKLPISGGRKIRNGQIVGGMIEEQIVASNIDTAFIVCGLDQNFNLQRLERYITLVYNSGISPVILLNKADLCEDIGMFYEQVHGIAFGIPVFAISVMKGIGMEAFEEFMQSGKTIVFLGSSGVGKSTITNYLLGQEKQKVNEISDANGKGRHTTTSKELFFHDSGCMIIDTPGLRELQLWGDHSAVESSFRDVLSIATGCKYKDCSHEREPGCAIRKAIEEHILSQERYESYRKQSNELQTLSKTRREFEINMNRKNKRNC